MHSGALCELRPPCRPPPGKDLRPACFLRAITSFANADMGQGA
jgi:hypothetical protein